MTTYVLGLGRGHNHFSLFPLDCLDGYAKNGVIGRVRTVGTFDAPTWEAANQMVNDYMGYGVYTPMGGR